MVVFPVKANDMPKSDKYRHEFSGNFYRMLIVEIQSYPLIVFIVQNLKILIVFLI